MPRPTAPVLAALVALAAMSGGAGAATLTDYSSFHVLGDSLSDTGNVYRLTLGFIPKSPPYWKGRFSNGPVWADRVGEAFGDAGVQNENHAWGGAKARTDGDASPDLRLQAERYASLSSSRRGERPLVAIWAGGNDILARVGDKGMRKTGRRAANAVGATAERLARAGVTDFVMFNLPDLGRIPDTALSSDPRESRSATAGSRSFNSRLKRRVAGLRDDGLRIKTVDIYSTLNALIESPRDFGLRNVTRPCIDDDGSVCSARAGRRRAFFDDIHPNKVVHRRVAEIVLDEIEGRSTLPAMATQARPEIAAVPLPLPAFLLGAACAALVTVGRRRPAAPRRAARPRRSANGWRASAMHRRCCRSIGARRVRSVAA